MSVSIVCNLKVTNVEESETCFHVTAGSTTFGVLKNEMPKGASSFFNSMTNQKINVGTDSMGTVVYVSQDENVLLEPDVVLV